MLDKHDRLLHNDHHVAFPHDELPAHGECRARTTVVDTALTRWSSSTSAGRL